MSAFGPAAEPGYCTVCRYVATRSTVQEWMQAIDHHETIGDRSVELAIISEGITQHVIANGLGPSDVVEHCACGEFRTVAGVRRV